MNPLRRFALSTLLLGSVVSAFGAAIVPTSYSFNMGPGYTDDTGSQLTDGLYADLTPSVSLTGYEWVGWDGGVPLVTFTFGSVVSINQVTLSMANWTAAAVYLPESIKIGGTAFTIDPDSYPNLDHAVLTFAGGWTGSSLTLELDSSYNRWIFLDEVTFNEGAPLGGGAGVPDSGLTLALTALPLLGLVAFRRRLSAQ